MSDSFDTIRDNALSFVRDRFPSRDGKIHPKVTKKVRFQWPSDFQRNITRAMTIAWAPGTIKSYNTGITAYRQFCKAYRIPNSLVFPASEFIICAFVASRLHLAPSTLKNYLAGLRAWHIKENKNFPTSARIWLIVKAPRLLESPSVPKKPISVQLLHLLAQNLQANDPLDAACLACALTAFWGLCWMGELLPLSSHITSPLRWPSRSNLQPLDDGFVLSLPWTKTGKWNTQQVFLAPQLHQLNPISALSNHLKINNPGSNLPLFSFLRNNEHTPLTKPIFLAKCNTIWSQASATRFTGHSFRIGGTTHYLQSGIHPDIIKTLGRWSSDSFLRYWRNLDKIIPAEIRYTEPARDLTGRRALRLGHGHASTAGRPRRHAALPPQ